MNDVEFMSEYRWKTTYPPRDIPYDGCPQELEFINRQRLKIQCYRWIPQLHSRNNVKVSKGTIVILHGIKSHVRFGWLCKGVSRLLINQNDLLNTINIDNTANKIDSVTFSLLSKISKSFTNDNDLIDIWSLTDEAMEKKDPLFIQIAKLFELAHKTNSLSSFGNQSTTDSSEDVMADIELDMDEYIKGPEKYRNSELFYDGSWVQQFVELGFTVVGMDLQGHGRSDSYDNIRLNIRLFDDYMDDLDDFLTIVRSTCTKSIDVPLIMMTVSLSTLITTIYFTQPRSKRHNIYSLYCISAFWSLGKTFNGYLVNKLVQLLQFIVKINPNKDLKFFNIHTNSLIQQWQEPYRKNDPYLIKKPVLINTILQLYAAVSQLQNNIIQIVKNESLKNIYILHNYNDKVIPVELSVLPFTTLKTYLENCTDIKLNLQCIVFNIPQSNIKNKHLYDQWHKDVIKIHYNFDLAHTLITDKDNYWPFLVVYTWLLVDHLQYCNAKKKLS